MKCLMSSWYNSKYDPLRPAMLRDAMPSGTHSRVSCPRSHSTQSTQPGASHAPPVHIYGTIYLLSPDLRPLYLLRPLPHSSRGGRDLRHRLHE